MKTVVMRVPAEFTQLCSVILVFSPSFILEMAAFIDRPTSTSQEAAWYGSTLSVLS